MDVFGVEIPPRIGRARAMAPAALLLRLVSGNLDHQVRLDERHGQPAWTVAGTAAGPPDGWLRRPWVLAPERLQEGRDRCAADRATAPYRHLSFVVLC